MHVTRTMSTLPPPPPSPLPQGITTLQVTITDVNDERPQFVQDTYFAQVPENSPQGTQVLPVRGGSGRKGVGVRRGEGEEGCGSEKRRGSGRKVIKQ